MGIDEGGPFIKLSDPGIPITVLTREGKSKLLSHGEVAKMKPKWFRSSFLEILCYFYLPLVKRLSHISALSSAWSFGMSILSLSTV